MKRKVIVAVLLLTGSLAQAVSDDGAESMIQDGSETAESRMRQLMNESEDLRQAREEIHRFWMNNQPAVINRVNGTIGP